MLRSTATSGPVSHPKDSGDKDLINKLINEGNKKLDDDKRKLEEEKRKLEENNKDGQLIVLPQSIMNRELAIYQNIQYAMNKFKESLHHENFPDNVEEVESSPQVSPLLPTMTNLPEGFEYDNRDDSIDIVPIKKEYQDKQRQNMTDKQHVEIQADRDIEAARRFYEENPMQKMSLILTLNYHHLV